MTSPESRNTSGNLSKNARRARWRGWRAATITGLSLLTLLAFAHAITRAPGFTWLATAKADNASKDGPEISATTTAGAESSPGAEAFSPVAPRADDAIPAETMQDVAAGTGAGESRWQMGDAVPDAEVTAAIVSRSETPAAVAWSPAIACTASQRDAHATPATTQDVQGAMAGEAPCIPAESSAVAAVGPTHPALAPATSGVAVSSERMGALALSTLPAQSAVTVPAIRPAHPRLLLDSDTLAALRGRATSSNPQWKALKATCDSYIGGIVEFPKGNAYPDLPNLGQGYQGSDYVPAMLAEGLCYQVLKSSNASAAAPYGAKAVDILLKMSVAGAQGQAPCTDSGYGIRFYGVGFGLGYDWTHELLTPAQRTQVYTTANAWVSAWEQPNGCADFEYAHPQSNYFAGYFHAKAAIAMATYGENPAAPAQWSDWMTNQFAKRVQPYYRQHLLGGGWPEGYANYASLGILNMSMPIREVQTATGLDLLHAAAPYTYPVDSADYSMHFTWPSRAYFDDRDTNHSNSTSLPPGTTQVGMFEQILGALVFWKSPRVGIFRQYLTEVDKATSGYGSADAWLRFLAVDPAITAKPLSILPRSYMAPGLGAVAARSDWSTTASWMSFRAGPYVNNPGQGEEYFDQGSLALVRGNTPVLLNASGWVVHNPNGTADEDNVYNDNYGSFNANKSYVGNRQIYNVYYVKNVRAGALAESFGQAAYTTEDQQVRTRVSSYEDGGDYVYLLATGLEDMYRTFAAGPAVVGWSRQIIYLRPNRFVVYDRTVDGSSSYDQYLAWHFPANPVKRATTTGGNRLDVTYSGRYAGAMITVLPKDATATTAPMYPTSNPVKAWQVQVRPPNGNVSQKWLTVFDLSSTSSAVATATAVVATKGAIVGVQLAAGDGNQVVVGSAGAAGVPINGGIGYSMSAIAARHIVTDLLPRTGYTVSASCTDGVQSVSVSLGGTTMSSAKGVLNFLLDAAGTVETGPGPISSAPVSSLPVAGFPQPYHL